MNTQKDSATPPAATLPSNADYKHWLGQVKAKFHGVQLKAAVAVNSALLQFY